MARIAVLGASGFLGSHLCDYFLSRGDEVVGVDDFSTSTGENIRHLMNVRNFSFINSDISVSIPIDGKLDGVLNFASPASPPRYLAMPIHTLRTGSLGTENALNLAIKNGARFVMASTSEIYGDPSKSPQDESYWGNVNSVGERSCYDEAKRYAEALCVAYSKTTDLNLGIVRIFNTYGPRLDKNDGRVVSNFIYQALSGEDITIYGDGLQTRSFCYVSDEIKGIAALFDSSEKGPINIGNPHEFSMLELANIILTLTESPSKIVFRPLPADDPLQRCPDISLARTKLNWSPEINLSDGLLQTIDWFRATYFG